MPSKCLGTRLASSAIHIYITPTTVQIKNQSKCRVGNRTNYLKLLIRQSLWFINSKSSIYTTEGFFFLLITLI